MRVQLALNVADLEAAVGFYSKLFRTGPVIRRPGYANFAIVEPSLKLVLFEGQGAPGTVNHLGIEVSEPEAVDDATARLGREGLATLTEDGVVCCHALQDKVWVDGPDDVSWEIYAVLADVEPAVDEPCCSAAPASADRCC